MDIIQKLKIEELLETREHLTDIAVELYGEMFITEDKFWDSPVEKDMNRVVMKLYDLGYRYEPSLKEKVIAKILKKDGKGGN